MKFGIQARLWKLPIVLASTVIWGEDKFIFISIGYQERKNRFDFWITLVGVSVGVFYIKKDE